MKKLSLSSLNELFTFLNDRPDTFLWIRSKDYKRQLYVSENYEKIWGHSSEQLYEYPNSWVEAVLTDDRLQIENESKMRYQHGEKHTANTLLYRIKNNVEGIKFIKDDSFVLIDDSGETIGFIGLGELLTESQWEKIILAQSNNQIDQQMQLKKYIFSILKNELHLEAKTQLPPNLSATGGLITVNEQLVGLTAREKECLSFLVMGKTAKQTALMMNISARTVEFHLNNIKEKMGCRSKLELISQAVLVLKESN